MVKLCLVFIFLLKYLWSEGKSLLQFFILIYNDEFVDFAHPEMLLLGHAAYPKNTVLHQLASGGVFTTSGPWLLREGPWLLPAWFLYVSELALFL